MKACLSLSLVLPILLLAGGCDSSQDIPAGTDPKNVMGPNGGGMAQSQADAARAQGEKMGNTTR